jgi:hypothetical protein
MANFTGKLMSLAEFKDLITQEPEMLHVVSGDESLLSQLPKGNWIGGTIPYMMTDEKGGLTTRDRLLVQQLPSDEQAPARISVYDAESIARIPEDGPANGYTFLLIPAFSEVHLAYGKDAPRFTNLFSHAIFGWVTGIHLDDMGKKEPKVFDGRTGEAYTDKAIALHVPLPEGKTAVVDIVNIFERSDGPDIRFETDGFTVTDSLIDGERTNFARWLTEQEVDTKLPLMADYDGALINVSIQNVDPTSGKVSLYAPVFKDRTYRVARPVPDYVQAFKAATSSVSPDVPFACNCVLNYLYGNLEGTRAGLPGPFTFGEIAYQLLNQTMVYCDVVDAAQVRERRVAGGLAQQMAHAG